MPQRNVWKRIADFHQDREPERLALKYKKLTADPLAFYRGTAHLFYEDLPSSKELRNAPHVWLCGDLHLENFGTYRADNRLTYFDVNDFDECCLGPLTFDVLRLMTSVAIEAHARNYKSKRAQQMMSEALACYQNELRLAKPRWVERETATGLIRELFDNLKCRTAGKFLDSRTVVGDGRRRSIDVENGKALPATRDDIAALEQFLDKETKFRLVDAARRIAGNGSLGVPRFVILAEDKAGNLYLLDLKEARVPAPVQLKKSGKQPRWESEAERVVKTQQLVLAMPPAFLHHVTFRKRSWILRELLPSEDRVAVSKATDAAFEEFVGHLASAMAWAQFRSTGRRGAAIGDTLCDYDVPVRAIIDYAQDYARQVESDWKEFTRRLSEERNSS